MILPSEAQSKQISKALSSSRNRLKKLDFKDIALDNLNDHDFRNCCLSPLDLSKVFIGKVVSSQKDSITNIICKLQMNNCISSSTSRSSIVYRANQVDSKKYLDHLLSSISTENVSDYKETIFDGTHVRSPNNVDACLKYSKSKNGKDSFSQNPIIKIHYLITREEHTCLGAIISDFNISERVALAQHGINEKLKGRKLHIIADRGLYGAMLGYLLEKCGHKFSLRLGGNYIKKLKKYKFKKDSLVMDFNLTSDAVETYKHLGPELKTGIFRMRVVRKKGSGKRKAIYIMTNDYDTPAEEILGKYLHRQRIEDGFKYLKSYGGMEKIHFNTGLQNIELILATLFYYISIVEKILFQLIETPRPDENGALTANRALAWQLFFEVFKFAYKLKKIEEFGMHILSNLIKIRTGRWADRYVIRTRKDRR